jgi:hypothetical protein
MEGGQESKAEGIIKGGSPQMGEWEISRSNTRIY